MPPPARCRLFFFFFLHARNQRCAAFARCAADAYARRATLDGWLPTPMPLRRYAAITLADIFAADAAAAFIPCRFSRPPPMIRADAAILLAMPPPLYAPFTLIAYA
jgi:hypothetical protein